MFLASRMLLLLFATAAGLLAVELLWFGAVNAGVAFLNHEASFTGYLSLLGGLIVLSLCVIGLNYVFRPPALRSRYWTVLAALAVATSLGVLFLLHAYL